MWPREGHTASFEWQPAVSGRARADAGQRRRARPARRHLVVLAPPVILLPRDWAELDGPLDAILGLPTKAESAFIG